MCLACVYMYLRVIFLFIACFQKISMFSPRRVIRNSKVEGGLKTDEVGSGRGKWGKPKKPHESGVDTFWNNTRYLYKSSIQTFKLYNHVKFIISFSV